MCWLRCFPSTTAGEGPAGFHSLSVSSSSSSVAYSTTANLLRGSGLGSTPPATPLRRLRTGLFTSAGVSTASC